MDVIFFKSSSEFRKWLSVHHAKEKEAWLGFYNKGASKTGITYKESVDEALCYGWIDGHIRKVDAESHTRRFTPRKARSNWSLVNVKRVEELTREGRMAQPGLDEFAKYDPATKKFYSFEQAPHELSAEETKAIKANKAAWAFFDKKAPGYKRIAAYWIHTAKREETRARRLQVLIECSERGKVIPLADASPNGKKTKP